MNFAFTEEQEELRSIVRSFLEDKSPESAVRELMETENGYDQAVWSQMAEQLGLQAIKVSFHDLKMPRPFSGFFQASGRFQLFFQMIAQLEQVMGVQLGIDELFGR